MSTALRFADPAPRSLLTAPATAVAAVWICSAVVAVLSPDMVTGSEHEHLPLAAMTVWPWTFAATAYVLMAGRRGTSVLLGVGTATIWACVAVVALASPVMVTGTDPTRIPVAALLAPPVGALATALVALQHTTRPDRPDRLAP